MAAETLEDFLERQVKQTDTASLCEARKVSQKHSQAACPQF